MKDFFVLRLSVFVLLFLLVGCKKVDEVYTVPESADCIKVDFSEEFNDIKDINITDYVDSVILIKLETKEESLLGSITGVRLSENRIFVLDYFNGASISIFSIEGKFIKRIPTGEGPKELNQPLAFTYDSFNKELLVWQPSTMKKFSEDGDFIAEYSTKYFVNHIIPLSDNRGYLLCHFINTPNSIYELLWTDKEFNVQKIFQIQGVGLLTMDLNSLNYDDNFDVNFSRDTDDNIYSVQGGDLLIKRKIIIGDKEFDTSKLKHITDYETFRSAMAAGDVAFKGGFCETQNYELYYFDSSYGPLRIYRNKDKGNLIGGHVNFKGSVVDFVTSCEGVFQNNFVCVLENHFRDNSKPFYYNLEGNKKILSPNQMEMLKNFTENDNPIIMLYSLKDPD